MIGSQNTGLGNVQTAGQPPGGGGGGAGGGFGSDTIVQLPNDAAVNVQALRLLLTLSNDDAGNEASNWLFQMIRAGAVVSALQFIQQVTLHSNSRIQLPDEWNFLVDTDTGFVWWGPNTIALKLGGQIFGTISEQGIALAPALTGNTNFFFAGTDAGMYYKSDLSGTVQLRPNPTSGCVEVGLSGVLATNADHGFASIPRCAGTPTGVPGSITAGMVPLVVDSTNNKLYGFYGAAWHDLTGA